MSGNFLTTFLSVVSLPDDLADDVIDAYGPRYGEHLAENHSLGRHALRLLKRPLSGDAIANILAARDPEVREFVLNSKESSMAATWAVLNYWNLSPADQLRLAKRPLPKSTANRMLDLGFSDATHQVVLPRASASDRLNWLVDSEISDDDLYKELLVLATKETAVWDLANALTLRPELRSRALHSDVLELRIAACWTELSRDDHEYASNFAMECELFSVQHDPVIGLLSQPGLDPNQRYELDEWIDIQSRLGRQRSFNKRFRYARLHYSVTNRARYVYDRDDPGDISTLINFVGYLARPRGRRSVFMSAQNKAIATMLIYELSRSEHLDEAQLTRLAQALFAHSDVRYGPGTPVLGAALRNMATQLNLGDTALGYFRGLSQQLPTASTLAALLKEVATYEETEPSGTVSNWYHEKTSTDPASYMLGLSVANLSQRTNYNVGNLQALSPEFSAQLGDATSPVSKRSWLLFLGFVEDDPDVPLQNVLDTAKKLAGIDA